MERGFIDTLCTISSLFFTFRFQLRFWVQYLGTILQYVPSSSCSQKLKLLLAVHILRWLLDSFIISSLGDCYIRLLQLDSVLSLH